MLKELGIPEEAILIEVKSRNTHENAQFTKPLLEEHGFTKILLVTSALHMPRALAEFQRGCPDVIPAPTDFERKVHNLRIVLDLIPDAGALADATRVFKEIVGRTVQRATAGSVEDTM